METTPNRRIARGAEVKRLVGLERRYECRSCGSEHRSWSRVRTCPGCGEPLAIAVIRRAAVAAV